MSFPDPARTAIEAVVHQLLDRVFPACVVVVNVKGEEVYARAFGRLGMDAPLSNCPADLATVFDLASVSKLFTVTAFMTLVEAGQVAFDQPVCEVLPEFTGMRAISPYPDPLQVGALVSVVPATNEQADAGRVTFRHLLVHNSGLPAWLPLYRQNSRAGSYETALQTAFAYPIGERVVYSDIGLILVGLALERMTGKRLDGVVQERVTQPLRLDGIAYGPLEGANVAPTEICQWRQRRLIGEVHDENAGGMEGVAGHAGLFGHARDVARLGEMYRLGGSPLLKPETVGEMTRLQAQSGGVRKGLGFMLWSPDLDAANNPFSPHAYGHTGFTGTSLWIDPARDLVTVTLTNRVYFGRANAAEMAKFRVTINQIIARAARAPG